MNIRFNTDRETGLPHIYKHGVNAIPSPIILGLDRFASNE